MKKFKFRLEPLLKVRSHIEKQRQKEHATALQQVYLQRDHLEKIEAERQSTMERQRDELVGVFSPAQVQTAWRYLSKLKRDSWSGAELLKGLEQEAEKRRLKLVDASKEKKMFEKLKERQRIKRAAEAEQIERKDLDEIAVSAYGFRHRQ